MFNTLARCLKDEQGNELIEYALLLGMIVCAAIFMMGALGIKVVQRWARIYDIL